ncbi:uncharacterized protein BDV14DRAFT_204619 [Aspergillus stella-maris]|uniref:uncharacterized protein n=1 Tax=Aspergillus stella-maris TaxID=1810926 RepID=UPI003CCDDC9C
MTATQPIPSTEPNVHLDINLSDTVPLCSTCNEHHPCERIKGAVGTSSSDKDHGLRRHSPAASVTDEEEAETEIESEPDYYVPFARSSRGLKARVPASVSPMLRPYASGSEQEDGVTITLSTDTIPSTTAATQSLSRINRSRAGSGSSGQHGRNEPRAQRRRQRNAPPCPAVAHRSRPRAQGVPDVPVQRALRSDERPRLNDTTPSVPFAVFIPRLGDGRGDGETEAQGTIKNPMSHQRTLHPVPALGPHLNPRLSILSSALSQHGVHLLASRIPV